MKYTPRELFGLLGSPIGRHQFLDGIRYRAFPLYAAAARLHRARLPASTRFVAVVGSFGKTTTSRALRAALGQDPQAHVAANSWSRIAQRVLAARARDAHVVIEAGIAGLGEMARYAAVIRPDVTVVTAVGSEHHRSLGTLDDTRNEKADMVRALRPAGLAVLNGDDPNVLWMRGETGARVLTFGLGDGNDVRGGDLRLDWPHGMELTIEAGGASARLRVPLFGEKMAYPLLAATAVALDAGRSLDDVAQDLARLPPTPGRMQPAPLPGGVWLLRDEYKSAPETVHAALDALATIPARRRVVVMGDVSEPVGPQGPVYREIGARLAEIADLVVVTSAKFQPIAAGARRAGIAPDAILDAGRAVHEVVALLRRVLAPGDVVLLKGRDTQHLERIYLALAGREVRCRLVFCDVRLRCDRCPMLARGWSAHVDPA